MAGYTSGVFYMDYVNGSDTARTALTSVIFSDSGTGPTLATKVGHGLITGAIVDVTLTTNWNGAWKITRIDDDTFTLDGSTWVAGGDNDGTVTPRGGQSWADAWKTINSGATSARIQGGDLIKIAKTPDPTSLGITALWTGTAKAAGGLPATKNIGSTTNATPIVVTINNHGYSDGDVVQILGHSTNTAANGDWIVQNKTANTFELANSVGNGVGGATGTCQLINSKCVKLSTSLTKTLHLCDVAWTAGANCTVTLETSTRKQGYGSMKCVTGNLGAGQELAYIDLGSQVDFSLYKQVSLWFQNAAALSTAGDLKLKMYSDAGRTTEVESFDFPALAYGGYWMPYTFNKGAALASDIRCISLVSNIAMNAKTFYLDDIVACKDATSDDALTLSSLIGKNSTKQGSADGWYGIQSINGQIVLLDVGTNSTAAQGRGYSGTTETVTTYKRETLKWGYNSDTAAVQTLQDSGTAGSPIQYQGGYDTSSGLQDGETIFDGANGCGYGLTGSGSYNTVNWLGFVRYNRGISMGGTGQTLTNVGVCSNNREDGCYIGSATSFTITKLWHASCNGSSGINIDNNYGACLYVYVAECGILNNNGGKGFSFWGNSDCSVGTISYANNNADSGVNVMGSNQNVAYIGHADYNTNPGVIFYANAYHCRVDYIGTADYNSTDGVRFNGGCVHCVVGYVSANYNSSYGINFVATNYYCRVLSGATSNNSNPGVYSGDGWNFVNGIVSAEGTKVGSSFTDHRNWRLHVNKYNGDANDHRIYTDNGTIVSDTTIRHTDSGIAWKFAPTSVKRNYNYPLKMTVAKVACAANALVTVKIWMKKSSATEVVGKLVCKAYQLSGITSDQIATKASDTSWEELTITFTPTEAGVVEIEVWCYIAGTSTTDYIHIDDMTITQA